MSLPLIYNLSLQELADHCQASGFPKFRAKQIWNWIYSRNATTWDAMHNIPPDTRLWLSQTFCIKPDRTSNIEHSASNIESTTQKILVTLPDGEAVEAVIIPSRHKKTVEREQCSVGSDQKLEYQISNERPTDQQPVPSNQSPATSTQPPAPRTTLCISCQVGCRFNCAFCASGQAGLIRNLDAGEMVLQVIAATSIIGSRPSNIVFMGIGEPFDNYDQTLKAARILNDPNGLKIGARKITISTSGIIPGIERFAKEGIQFELSVSLHAPTNAIRSQLMPINKKYPLQDLIETCKQYTRDTNRIITFEYTLIRDLNDKPEHAYQLIKLLRKLHCRVNLIPLSPIDEFNGKPSTDSRSQMFIETLNNAHINATLRKSKGASLKAACGQLRFKGK